jgi:hypothetical protein
MVELAVIVLGMFCFGYALVIYRAICGRASMWWPEQQVDSRIATLRRNTAPTQDDTTVTVELMPIHAGRGISSLKSTLRCILVD